MESGRWSQGKAFTVKVQSMFIIGCVRSKVIGLKWPSKKWPVENGRSESLASALIWNLYLPLIIFIFIFLYFFSMKMICFNPDIYMESNKRNHLSSFWHMWWWTTKCGGVIGTDPSRDKRFWFCENAWNISGLMLPGNFFNHFTSSSVLSIPRISHKLYSKYPGLEHSLFYLGAIVWPHFRFYVNSDMILTSGSLLLSTTNQIQVLTPSSAT